MSVGVKRAAPNSIPTDYKKLRGDLGEEDVLSNQVDYDDEKPTSDSELLYYTTVPDKQTADTLATLSAAGTINNQIMKSPFAGGEQQTDEEKASRPQSTDEETIEEDNRQSNYKTEMSSNRNTVDERQQYYMNHDVAEETSSQSDKNIHKEQTFAENDYSEDEILDPSDKDQRNNMRLQNGMRMYESTQVRGKEEKEKETQQEEPNYDDTDGEDMQEDERDMSDSVAAKTTVHEERVPNYNAHQKQLPFGAKLRPKRV